MIAPALLELSVSATSAERLSLRDAPCTTHGPTCPCDMADCTTLIEPPYVLDARRAALSTATNAFLDAARIALSQGRTLPALRDARRNIDLAIRMLEAMR